MERLLPKNKVYLDVEVKQEYPTASLAPDETAINFRTRQNLRPVCFHCGDHNLSYGQQYFWHRCASFEHFYCYYCFDHSLKRYTHTCVDGEPILDECQTIEHLLCGKLKFQCKFSGCRKIFAGANLKQHELGCESQPKRECPVDGCEWVGRLDEMERDHFRDGHQDAKIILRNVILKMDSGKTYYLMILGKFVSARYVAEELGEVYEHGFALDVAKESLDYAKPVGLVTAHHTLLKKIDGSGSVKSVRKDVVLFVYFEDK